MRILHRLEVMRSVGFSAQSAQPSSVRAASRRMPFVPSSYGRYDLPLRGPGCARGGRWAVLRRRLGRHGHGRCGVRPGTALRHWRARRRGCHGHGRLRRRSARPAAARPRARRSTPQTPATPVLNILMTPSSRQWSWQLLWTP